MSYTKERIEADGMHVNLEDAPYCRVYQTEEDAKRIVHCVNNYDRLVEALEGIIQIGKRDLSNPKYDGYFEEAKQAIAKAEEE